MKKRWLALLAVLALSVGVAWAEGKNGKTGPARADGAACWPGCTGSCPK